MTVSAGLTRYTNNPSTTLNGGINASVTSIVVTSALGFPNPGPFRILIDNELMQVTGGYNTTTWTVARGIEGTIGATHSNLATVTLVATAFEFNSFRQEFNVLAYGAKGDGVTDDTTAFQNAINDVHALANGGYIFIPTLGYKIQSSLTTYANVGFLTYGATFTGARAASVSPLINNGLTVTLTLPAALTVSAGGASITGGLTIVSGGLALSGGGTINGNLTLAASQSSGQIGLAISPANVGSVTGETIVVQHSALTLTITGGYSNQRFTLFAQPTITAGSSLTVSTAATVAIAGAPVAGGSAVLTNSYALWIQAGGLNLADSSNNTVPIIPSASGARLWIQSGDPGVSANNGDIWFQG